MNRQTGLNLDSPEDTDDKDKRNRYKVVTHVWLLKQMTQPKRHLYSDVIEQTLNKFLDELLSARNFLLHRVVAGAMMRVPRWDH